MKTCFICLLVLFFGASSATAGLMSVVEDNFNTYANGPIVGQGGWFDRENGLTFAVQDDVVYEGTKAIHSSNVSAFGIITKTGTPFTDGHQSFYVRPENSQAWESPLSVQIGMFQDSWDGPSRAVMDLRNDGYSYYIDSRTDQFVPFDTFIDGAWNLVDIQWRAVDTSARYRINEGTWTDWIPFIVRPSYSYFDTVGISAISLGSGGVYFDTFGSNPVPEPSTIVMLISGLTAGILFRLRRK